MRRLFFALWPPAALADEIVPRAARLGLDGRLIARDQLHLTLVFLGPVRVDAIDALRVRAGQIESTPFTLIIDRISGFADTGHVWFGPTATPPALAELAAGLAAIAGGPGLDRAVFVPHISVLRGANSVPQRPLFPSLIWPVQRFALVESGAQATPGRYRTLAEWPLGSRPGQGMK